MQTQRLLAAAAMTALLVTAAPARAEEYDSDTPGTQDERRPGTTEDARRPGTIGRDDEQPAAGAQTRENMQAEDDEEEMLEEDLKARREENRETSEEGRWP